MNSKPDDSIFTAHASVHASAGSGKTYLLVSRIIRLLLEDTPPSAILAITFTRKAAAEMQTRLLQRLYHLAACDEDKLKTELANIGLTAKPAIIHHARMLYEKLLQCEQPVKTTTFHAFCQDLLRRFPLEADAPPGFELLERNGVIQDEAWEALMVEAAQQTTTESKSLADALSCLFSELGLHNTRQALRNFLQYRSDWWAYTANDHEAVETAGDKLAEQLDITVDAEPIADFLKRPLNIQNLREFHALLEKHPTKTNQGYGASLAAGMDGEQDQATRFAHIEQVFFTNEKKPRSRKPSKTQQNKMGEAGEQRFLELHETICEAIMQLQERLNAKRNLTVNCAWYRAGHAFVEHYQRIKQSQRLLDFTDLEWKTYQLLNQSGNTHWVQYKLDERIEHILIDEFQDTNPTQWHMLLPLLQELAAGHHEQRRSVFLVGDAKQSIYRFRRAEPRLFEQASMWLNERLGAQKHPLNKSYRSAPPIIDFVNKVFGTGDLQQLLDDFQEHKTERKQLWGEVTLLPLAREEQTESSSGVLRTLRNPLEQPRPPAGLSAHALEARQVAVQIAALLESGTHIQDGEQVRPLRYSDIIILLRARTHIGEYEKELRSAGIPFLGAERGTLLDSLEAGDMLRLLQWLSMPFDDLALASILRSPLFAVSDDDLLQLAAAGKGNWGERLQNLQTNLSDDAALKRAHHCLQRWRELAGHIPVHDLLDRIYSEGNVLARYAAASAPHQRPRVQANLIRFLELALEMDSGRYPSLMRFTAWLAELRQDDTDAPDEPGATDDANRVRLLTIHASKGLEAPVVFLTDAARSVNEKSAYSVLVEWPVANAYPQTFMLGAGKKQQDTFSAELNEQAQKDTRREETNLLYVALTRSQQYLYISGSPSKKQQGIGWYGQIARQYALAPEELETPQILESQTAPPIRATAATVTQAPPEHPDPRLSAPIHVQRMVQEIAPSRSLDTQRASGGVGDADGRLRGIVIHRMLEKLADDPTLSLNETLAALPFEMGQAELESCWNEACAVIHHPDLQHFFTPAGFEQAYNEVPLYYYQAQRLVHGVVDRLVLMPDKKIHLIDYKTHQLSTADALAHIAEEYKTQMRLYAEGVRKLWPDYEITPALLFTHAAKLWPLAV